MKLEPSLFPKLEPSLFPEKGRKSIVCCGILWSINNLGHYYNETLIEISKKRRRQINKGKK